MLSRASSLFLSNCHCRAQQESGPPTECAGIMAATSLEQLKLCSRVTCKFHEGLHEMRLLSTP